MNVTRFYRELFEYTLTLDVLGLENQFKDLVELVNSKTLLGFSNLIPMQYLHYLDLTDRSLIVKKENHTLGVEYLIKDDVLDRYRLPILDVVKIEYNNVGAVDPYDPDSTAYYNSVITSRQNLTLESVFFGAEYTYNRTLTDTAMPFKRYHELRGPRILYLRNYAIQGTVEVVFKTCWPNIVSIPEEYHEILMDLAKYDIQIYLWGQLKYLESITTPAGNIELRVNWDGAEQERKDFLRELRSKSFPDRVANMYIQLL